MGRKASLIEEKWDGSTHRKKQSKSARACMRERGWGRIEKVERPICGSYKIVTGA